MEFMFENGKIIYERAAYPIRNVEASFGYDMHDVEGVVRMTRLEIESDAPFEINSEVENYCFNELCADEFVVEDENWAERARESIKKFLGVDYGKINIEIQ